MVFGVLLAGSAALDRQPGQVRTLAEPTFVLVPLQDSSTVGLTPLRRDPSVAPRLLLIVPLGALLAGAATAQDRTGRGGPSRSHAHAGGAWLAAAAMPTPSAPAPVRRAPNADSGLNDRLATPVVAAVAVLLGGDQPVRD